MSFESPEPDTEPPSPDTAPGEGPVSGEAALAGGEESPPIALDETPAPSEPVTTERAETAEQPTPAVAAEQPTPAETPAAPEHAEPAQEGAAGEPAAPQRPPQPRRRRRPSAADRHRRAFYARLTEVRKQGDSPPQAEPVAGEAPPAAEAESAEPVEAPAAQASSPSPEAAPAPTEPAAPTEQAAPTEPAAPTEQSAPGEPGDQRSGRSQARLVAAVERVGGPDVVREALSPQRREDGPTQKWSAVCCDRAAGLKPGDPVFQAWVRLASTPVREVKSVAAPPREDRPRRGGRRNDQRGRSDRQDRPSRGSASGGDMAALGRDGSFRPSVRIIGLEDAEASKREREETRRAERDAKRQAEAERLARLGY